MSRFHLQNLAGDTLKTLPLVVLYLTDGCNSRCVMCDIWRNPRRNMSADLIERVAEAIEDLKIRWLLLSGGEAMQHPSWPTIAQRFRERGVYVMLLTNGLLVKKQARAISESVDELIVSLDAGTPETYHAIRGVDAFQTILAGIQAVRSYGTPVSTRTTLQRANYAEFAQIIRTARDADVTRISFLTVDVGNAFAFGPRALVSFPDEALRPDDVAAFEALLDRAEEDFAAEFASGLIAESPAKLRRMATYFRAIATDDNALFDTPHCNAPHISLVVEVDGRLRPCYFLPEGGQLTENAPLVETLNTPELIALRRAYRTGERSECERCVCPLYKGPRALWRM